MIKRNIYNIRAHEILLTINIIKGKYNLNDLIRDWKNDYGSEIFELLVSLCENMRFVDKIKIINNVGDFCKLGCPYLKDEKCIQGDLINTDMSIVDNFFAKELNLKINKSYFIFHLLLKLKNKNWDDIWNKFVKEYNINVRI